MLIRFIAITFRLIIWPRYGVVDVIFIFLLSPLILHRAKHPVKVHLWAGISLRGATGICIFDGIMNALLYIDILDQTLLPYIQEVYPEKHRFMQDNDPKHTSRAAAAFMEEHGVTWWKTPAESPDCNPIENLWHELKEFIRREVKPLG